MVSHDAHEGAALDPLVWSAGALPKRRRLVDAVGAHAMLLGLAVIWTSDWVGMLVIAADDRCAWPYSVGVLVKWVAFLGTLHSPASVADLGVGGVSYVELLLFFELWAGGRLVLEKALPRYRGPCQLFLLVQAMIFGYHVGSLGLSCGHHVLCLVVLAGLFLA